MTFGYSNEVRTTLKSWTPKLRDMFLRLAKVEEDRFELEETKTSKVFLGSPVYRKCFDFGALPNTTTKFVSHGIYPFARLIGIYGWATNGTSHVPLPYADTTAAQIIELRCTNGSIAILTGFDYSAFNAFVVLEYTKLD